MSGADIRPTAAVVSATIVTTTPSGHTSTLPVVSATVAVHRVQASFLRLGEHRWQEISVYSHATGLVARWSWERASTAGHRWAVTT